MPVKWNKEQIEKLIICIEQNPCIYQVRSLDYIDRNKKAQAFNFVLDEIKKTDEEMTLSEIKRKWKVLRTQYMQEVRAIANSKKSGAGVTDIYTPKLWCFQHLHFLRTHSESRQSRDNTEITKDYMDNSNSTKDNTKVITESMENTSSTAQDKLEVINTMEASTSSIKKDSSSDEPPKKARKATGSVNGFRKDLENFKTILANRKTEKAFTWLGNLVTDQMEMIAPENQPDAAWEVQCLMRRLTRQSSQKQSSNADILQLSMEGLFEDEDFDQV